MFSPALRASALGFALGVLCAACAPGTAADEPVELRVGAPAPSFEARSDQGKAWQSADHFGKKWVVVYFYPGDFTPGCTAQANAFKDGMNKLTDLDERTRREVALSFDRLVNKLLHPPLKSLREEAELGAPHGLLEALKRLFHLKD